MEQIIVLQTSGKFESVDSAKVLLFEDEQKALEYCSRKTKPGKYWTKAEIVEAGKEIDLISPDDEE